MTVATANVGTRGWPWQFFEISGAILLALDAEGRVSYINQKGAETLGYPVQEILGKDWFDNFLPERIRPEVRNVFRQHQSGAANAPDRFENTVLCRDGSERIVAWRNTAVRDPSGKAVIGLASGDDVTEQRLAEADLRESERRFRAMFEQAAVGMAHVRLDGRFLRLNDKLCEITGYSRAELQARTFGDITHPDDLETDLAQIELLRSGAIPHYTREKRYIRNNGSVMWGQLTVTLLRDEAERPEYFTVVVKDITARKQAEALLEDEELQRMALSAADAGAWRWDAKADRFSWTPRVYAIFGLDPAKGPPTFARCLERCVHPADRSALARNLKNAVKADGAEFRVEFRCVHPDHGLRWVALAGHVLCGDRTARPALAYGIVQDVTARKEAEEHLRKNEERLRLAMKASNMGVWDWDIGSGEVSWSANLAESFGIAADEAPRNVEEWRTRVHPEDRERVDAAIEQALADQVEYSIEFRVIGGEGRVLWRGAHGSVIRDDSGRPVRMIGIDMDVSERKFEEERQHLLNGEMDHRMKNLMTMVHTIARQTLPAGTERDEFVGRLNALGKAHSVLSQRESAGAKLREIIVEELAAFPVSRVTVSGPEVSLAPRTAQMLTLMLHELTTNAAKHGALSGRTGTLSIGWSVEPKTGASIDLRWIESGGPPVRPPEREGFGSHMLRGCAKAAGGQIEISYAPEGLRVGLRIPLARADADAVERRAASQGSAG